MTRSPSAARLQQDSKFGRWTHAFVLDLELALSRCDPEFQRFRSRGQQRRFERQSNDNALNRQHRPDSSARGRSRMLESFGNGRWQRFANGSDQRARLQRLRVRSQRDDQLDLG